MSLFRWKCSPLNETNNKYYLPDLEDWKNELEWEPSVFGRTYIYSVDGNKLNCSGTVTAVEFCYTPSSDSELRKVFTLLVYTQSNPYNQNLYTKLHLF